MFRWDRLAGAAILSIAALQSSGASAGADPRFDGFNVIVAPDHPFGSAAAKLALTNAKQLGAKAIAVVPFFWQATPASPDLVRGSDMTDDELRTAIRDAHALGLVVLVKPHVWVPQSWAGAVAMTSEADWAEWFGHYQAELDRVARIAEAEKAEALAIGTELAETSQRPEWDAMIDEARGLYSGRLLYMAHNLEEADSVPFWNSLDAVGVTLYPPLGADNDRAARRATMGAIADRLDGLSTRTGKPVIVGEIGLRSARGAAAKPWESAEERRRPPDPNLQARVIADWLDALKRPAIQGVLIWRWFTDPDAGGLADTDFTVQGKPAERVLNCAWTGRCEQLQAGVQAP
jgi:hypothetical protein